jgi:site-specific recombinase XerD
MSTAPRMKVPGWLPWCRERDIDPLTVRRAPIDAYKLALQQAAYSAASISRRLAVVSSWYQYLADEEVIDHNPARGREAPEDSIRVSPMPSGSAKRSSTFSSTAANADGTRSAALIRHSFFAGTAHRFRR